MIQDVERNMPARGSPRDKAAIDVGPEGQPPSAGRWFQFPAGVTVLEKSRGFGPGDLRIDRHGIAHPGEFHILTCGCQASVNVERSPLAQLHRISQRLPDSLGRMAQLPDENQGPLISISLLDSCPARRTRCVLLAIKHAYLLLARTDTHPHYQRANCVIWMRLPQVSFSIAIVEPVTSVGGIVNSAPRALMRS